MLTFSIIISMHLWPHLYFQLIQATLYSPLQYIGTAKVTKILHLLNKVLLTYKVVCTYFCNFSRTHIFVDECTITIIPTRRRHWGAQKHLKTVVNSIRVIACSNISFTQAPPMFTRIDNSCYH